MSVQISDCVSEILHDECRVRLVKSRHSDRKESLRIFEYMQMSARICTNVHAVSEMSERITAQTYEQMSVQIGCMSECLHGSERMSAQI